MSVSVKVTICSVVDVVKDLQVSKDCMRDSKWLTSGWICCRDHGGWYDA